MDTWAGSRGQSATCQQGPREGLDGAPRSDGVSEVLCGNREGTRGRRGLGVQDHFPMHPGGPLMLSLVQDATRHRDR